MAHERRAVDPDLEGETSEGSELEGKTTYEELCVTCVRELT